MTTQQKFTNFERALIRFAKMWQECDAPATHISQENRAYKISAHMSTAGALLLCVYRYNIDDGALIYKARYDDTTYKWVKL